MRYLTFVFGHGHWHLVWWHHHLASCLTRSRLPRICRLGGHRIIQGG